MAPDLAKIILEETGVGAVAITDTQTVLAFVGIGSDHHKPGMALAAECHRAITQRDVLFMDGAHEPYHCGYSDQCTLGSEGYMVPVTWPSSSSGTTTPRPRARRGAAETG